MSESPDYSEETTTSPTPPASDFMDYSYLARPEPWMSQAVCKGQTHLFFSTLEDETNAKREPGRYKRIAAAKALCNRCPVKSECLEWAIYVKQAHGIAGGMTASERRRYVRKKRLESEEANDGES